MHKRANVLNINKPFWTNDSNRLCAVEAFCVDPSTPVSYRIPRWRTKELLPLNGRRRQRREKERQRKRERERESDGERKRVTKRECAREKETIRLDLTYNWHCKHVMFFGRRTTAHRSKWNDLRKIIEWTNRIVFWPAGRSVNVYRFFLIFIYSECFAVKEEMSRAIVVSALILV